MTLNNRLDYFGVTVNIASRVSRLARGDDVVLTEEMLLDREARAEAVRRGEIEPFESELRGYDRRFHLQRLVLGRGV